MYTPHSSSLKRNESAEWEMTGEKTAANLQQTTFFSLKSIARARNVNRSTEQRRREQQYRRGMKKKWCENCERPCSYFPFADWIERRWKEWRNRNTVFLWGKRSKENFVFVFRRTTCTVHTLTRAYRIFIVLLYIRAGLCFCLYEKMKGEESERNRKKFRDWRK